MAHPDARREEVLALLQANGGNVKRTARESGMPAQTVRRWKAEGAVLGTGNGAEKRGSLEDLLERIIWKAGDVLLEKLPEAKAAGAATALGVAFDKLQLLRGQPTQITEDVTHARTALHGRLGQLAARNGAGMVPVGAHGDAGELPEL